MLKYDTYKKSRSRERLFYAKSTKFDDMAVTPVSPSSLIADEYHIERIIPSHYPLLKIIYQDVFKTELSAQTIEKRFDTAALGLPVIGLIAIHKTTNTPAAYCGVFPFQAIVGDTLIQAGQRGDTMTHSAHRRKGLFTLLGKQVQEECRKEGIKILISQPNEQSFPATVNTLGWTKMDDIVRRDIKLDTKTIPLPKIAGRISFLQPLYNSYAKRLLKNKIVAISSFQNSLPTNYAKVNRDHKYLAYKKTTDKFFIRVEDITIWVKLTDVFWIGDFSDYGKITPAFISAIKRLAFRLGYNTIAFNLNASLDLPLQLQDSVIQYSEPSCMLYLDEQYKNMNFVLTAADFDTW